MTPADSAGQLRSTAPEHPAASALAWVDAFMAGACAEHVFLARILELESADHEVGWEVLALLDQLRRRRRLDETVFLRLKRKLQQQCMGYGSELAVSAAMSPTPPAPRSASASTPVTRPRLQVTGEEPLALHSSMTASPVRFDDQPSHLLEDEDQAELCLQPGDLLKGRYCIVQVHEQAGDASIKALDRVRSDLPTGRQCVAIHVLSHERSTQPKVMQRIFRLQSLTHSAIPRVFDVDSAGGRSFFTMEWVDGSSLSQIMQRDGAMAPGLPAVLSILGTLASALAHAHAKELAHGSVTLDNVQVTGRNELRLQGFVLDERTQTLTPEADCIAFAGLAHHLLSKCRAPLPVPVAGLRPQRERTVQRPPGLTSKQWRAMELALRTGDADAAAQLLTSMSGPPTAAQMQASAAVLPHRHARWQRSIHWPRWSVQMGAAASLLAVIGLGGNLLLGGTAEENARDGVVVAASAPPPASVSTPAAATVQTVTPASATSHETANASPVLAPRSENVSSNASREDAQPVSAMTVAAVPAPGSFQVTPLLLTSIPSRVKAGGLITAGFGAPLGDATAAGETPEAAPPGDVLDLPRAVIRVDGSQPVAKIWVRRRGTLRGPVTFFWWTETGTAQTARDFAQILRRWEVIDDGAAGIELHIPLSSDATRTQSRAFYVKIDRAGRGAVLGGRTLAQVEILPPRTIAANMALPKQ